MCMISIIGFFIFFSCYLNAAVYKIDNPFFTKENDGLPQAYVIWNKVRFYFVIPDDLNPYVCSLESVETGAFWKKSISFFLEGRRYVSDIRETYEHELAPEKCLFHLYNWQFRTKDRNKIYDFYRAIENRARRVASNAGRCDEEQRQNSQRSAGDEYQSVGSIPSACLSRLSHSLSSEKCSYSSLNEDCLVTWSSENSLVASDPFSFDGTSIGSEETVDNSEVNEIVRDAVERYLYLPDSTDHAVRPQISCVKNEVKSNGTAIEPRVACCNLKDDFSEGVEQASADIFPDLEERLESSLSISDEGEFTFNPEVCSFGQRSIVSANLSLLQPETASWTSSPGSDVTLKEHCFVLGDTESSERETGRSLGCSGAVCQVEAVGISEINPVGRGAAERFSPEADSIAGAGLPGRVLSEENNSLTHSSASISCWLMLINRMMCCFRRNAGMQEKATSNAKEPKTA